jgi:hypothetical protein
MEEVGIFYGHFVYIFVYFTDISYKLWPFGVFVGQLVYLLW